MRSRLVLSERGIEVVAQFTCPARRITQTYNFLIDTGSSASYLGWEDATKAGIKVEELPSSSKPIFGFGGAADVKHLKDPSFLHVRFEDNTLETVELPDGILVYRPSRRKTTHWQSGPSVSLLGRDFLRMSGWKLIANLPREEAYLESP
ncbi:MAG: hypothetical protein E6K08_08215 [Methanobacteriota archaeon]|nr:MAG: hypothetical protein E6K08_08215 [Euryarchaeota archaeon]